MLLIAGISIALFISALLLVKKDKSRSDLILFLWMMLNAAHLTLFSLFYSEGIYDYPFLLGLKFPFPLLHGVLLYYYVSSVTNQLPKNRFVIFLHLIPTIITYLYLIPVFLMPSDQKITLFKSGGVGYEMFQSVILVSVFISGIVYVILSSLKLRKHKSRIRNQFSDIEDINLKWLQFLTYGLGVVWSLVIFSQSDLLIYGGVAIFVILIGFFGIQQKNIFSNNESRPQVVKKKESEEETPKKEKYTKSGLSETKADEYYNSLDELIVEEKVYTNSELSLSDLALKLDIHPNYLSQIINEKEGKTFYDYINEFRIEEFKRLIAIPDNQQFTLMAIAYDCGFNSKSSFNRYFKKITGQTPSQYVKALNNQYSMQE